MVLHEITSANSFAEVIFFWHGLPAAGWLKATESKRGLGRGGHPRRGSAPVFRKIPSVVCSETVCAFMGPSAQIRQVCSALTGRLLPRGDDRMPGLGRFSQKVETNSGHWEKRLCHLQTHTIDLYYAHGKEWARLHPMPDRPGKTIPCRR